MYVISFKSLTDEDDYGFVADGFLPKGMKYGLMSELLIEHEIPFTHINKDNVFGFFEQRFAKDAARYIKEEIDDKMDGDHEFTVVLADTTTHTKGKW